MPITITRVPADSADAAALIAELDEYLAALPYPPESRHAFSVEKLLREGVDFFVAYRDGQPVGCCGLKRFGAEEYAEVKRMYVRPACRGLGVAKAMLDHLGAYARRERNVRALRLETGIYQTEAIGLYARCGFHRRPPFGEYREDPNSLYFEKSLA